jgi:hypothetical protein
VCVVPGRRCCGALAVRISTPPLALNRPPCNPSAAMHLNRRALASVGAESLIVPQIATSDLFRHWQFIRCAPSRLPTSACLVLFRCALLIAIVSSAGFWGNRKDGEAQQRHPEPALQEEVAVQCEDLVQPASAQGQETTRCVQTAAMHRDLQLVCKCRLITSVAVCSAQ